jgi:hypothetical protein
MSEKRDPLKSRNKGDFELASREYIDTYYLQDMAESLRIISGKMESLGDLDDLAQALRKWNQYYELNEGKP